MKTIFIKIIAGIVGGIILIGGLLVIDSSVKNQNIVLGANLRICTIAQGCTNTSSTPTDGQLLIGSGGSYNVGNLTAGSNITLSNGSGTITIASTGGGGGSSATTTINSVDGPTFTFNVLGTNGLSYSTSSGTVSLTQATSTGSQAGFLSSGDWTTFNNKQATITDGTGLTFSGATLNCDTASGSIQGCLLAADWTTFNNKQGNISFPLVYASTTHITATTPLTISSGILSMPTSTASQSGFLLSADWTIFNNKQSSITLSTSTSYANTVLAIASSSGTWTFNYPTQWNDFASIATSTGNLVVASSTGWKGLTIGTNGKVLMASSTAPLGVSWEATAGTGTVTSVAQTVPTGLTISGSPITTAGTLAIALDTGYEITKTASSSLWNTGEVSVSILNATTTQNGNVQKLFFNPITITEIQCSTATSSITIAFDERASTTAGTAGVDIFNGGSMICASGGTATTTFANSSIAAGNTMSLDLDSVPNATTSLRIHIKYQK